MPTQNYDGSWVDDTGQPVDMTSATNDAAYNARVWGDRTTDGPVPTPGTYSTGGFPPEIVAKLLQQPGVRAGIAYFLKKGERPDLNKIAALDQQVIPGYKNLGTQQVEDHSLRNGVLTGAAIVGGGAALQGLTTGFGAAETAAPAVGEAGDAAAEAALAGAADPSVATGTLLSTTSPFSSTIAGAPVATVPTQTSSLAALGDLSAPGGSTLTKVGNLLGDVGKGIGAIDTAAGNNRLNQEQLGLQANNSNITGQNAYENQVLGVDKANTTKDTQALKNQYLLEKAQHPAVSPFDVTGGVKYSPAYLASLSALAAKTPNYLAPPAPYVPINPADVQGATNTAPSTLSKIGQALGPALTVAPKIAALF